MSLFDHVLIGTVFAIGLIWLGMWLATPIRVKR